MVDKMALAQFIADTAFMYTYDIVGAVMAFTIVLQIVFFFVRIFRHRSFLNA